jgi:ABC-2 type transport system permease protein
MGTMEVLMVSPLNAFSIIIGKVTPYFVLSLINTASILALSVYVFGMPVQGSVTLLFAESGLFIFASLAIGIFISTVANNQQSAMIISNTALTLPTIMLSGYMFPINSMPLLLRWLSLITPARWFITIVKGIMLKGAGINYLWRETLVLIAMAAVFIILSVKNYKVRMK